MADLSILIPARNEEWLARTVEDIFANMRGDTEVIVVLDGDWAEPQLHDHPKLRVTHSATVIGQRAATNLAARMSSAKYVMKLDAHCSVAEGFDVELIRAGEELGHDVTQIPRMYNLHAFNWKCQGCGRETYQGPTPTACTSCAAKGTPGGPFERVVYWDRNAGGVPGKHVRSDFWRFDHDLHFQYHHTFKERPASRGNIVDVMSSVGAAFFMRRERFFELGGLDEAHGSWGQFGTEIACKSWLSGGRHVVNKNTWFAHLFRTQGGDFGFPYPMKGSDQDKARAHSRKLWLENTWPGQTRPLSWLIEKFAPLPDWHDPQNAEVLRLVQDRGRRFGRIDRQSMAGGAVSAADSGGVMASAIEGLTLAESDSEIRTDTPKVAYGVSRGGSNTTGLPMAGNVAQKGAIYYSDCRGDQMVLTAVREQLHRCVEGRGPFPVTSVVLAPIPDDFGKTIVLPLERGYLTMFKQILTALEECPADIIFHCEHDVLYHQSHFDFVPPRDDVFYFNQHTWRIDAKTGRALFYLCSQVSGLCAYRKILIDHYRKRVAHVEAHGFDRNLGFEPGTNSRARALDGRKSATWMSAHPNVDIKTDFCLTKGRWSQDQFRNKQSCLGWQESDRVPGWGVTLGRFDAFLEDVAAGRTDADTTRNQSADAVAVR